MDVETSVYVHFPWCLRKCPYCDFATRGIARERIPHAAYADGVLRELRWRADALEGRMLQSVFFGGGTPSLWAPEELARVLTGIRAAFPAAVPDLEVTAECNPSSLDRDRAHALAAAGVNRISIGVQSLDLARLEFLGRLHDRDGALRALEAAQREVPRVSADLLSGLHGETEAALAADVETLVAHGVEHVSVYSLTVEPRTPFGERLRAGTLPVATDAEQARAYEVARDTLAARGYRQYEVSNHARAGAEARHNLHTWRGGSYVGLGAAAVGCVREAPGRARRWRNHPDAIRYLDAQDLDSLEESEERLTPRELAAEALLLGLRTSEGVDRARAARWTGVDPLAGREAKVRAAEARGNLVCEGDAVRVPASRWLWLDAILTDLF